MWTVRAAAATLIVAVASCAGGSSSAGTKPSSVTAPGAHATTAGCPTDQHGVESLLGVTITHVEGATNGSTEQICAFSTSATDPGALSVVFLRFPRAELGVTSLTGARERYGSPLPGHVIASMPSWGGDAFLDDAVLPAQNLVAEFAWAPRFEIILGMHAGDRHVAERRQLIDRLVALTK